ncbi:hypothetical protein [Chitinilyticum piscinae]|uniref:Uncharacterized protein n=1 Tax=Chitinilyticum piscinae TaxID=2866724 RepID=A0A8J7K7M7_9NEIS|nr:hypothetical protein [Chitinilyticum piscinae]MBE9608308.1 hypothetical protein [Chitinilyticum piscinae]
MTLLLLLIMAVLGLAYAELFHRARQLVHHYYPDFELENERVLREQHFNDPRLLVARFNSDANGVTDLIFSLACRHAIPPEQHWVFNALYLVLLAMLLDLGVMFIYAFAF